MKPITDIKGHKKTMTHDVYKPGKNSLKAANASICGAHKT